MFQSCFVMCCFSSLIFSCSYAFFLYFVHDLFRVQKQWNSLPLDCVLTICEQVWLLQVEVLVAIHRRRAWGYSVFTFRSRLGFLKFKNIILKLDQGQKCVVVFLVCALSYKMGLNVQVQARTPGCVYVNVLASFSIFMFILTSWRQRRWAREKSTRN